jgi:RNA polymerase sigma-70 factor (sigma-E family)
VSTHGHRHRVQWGVTFEEYAYARGPALIRLARLLTGDRHLAEDLVQDVLARAYARWRRIGRLDQPDRYVRRMLVNAHHSWWRRRSSHELTVPVFPDRPGRADEAATVAERDAMWRHVAALPARQRTVIVLRYYEDLDDAAIAELMGCSAGTVRTHAKRALTTLRAAHTTAPAGPACAPTRWEPSDVA